MIRHEFNFISSGHGIIETYEPIGFDAAEFEISQDSNRKGRDVTSAGANNQKLRIFNIPEQPFDQFLYNIDTFGFESNIQYRIIIDDDEIIVGDCVDYVTDRVNYIEFTVVEVKAKTLFKTRYDSKTNLLSSTDLSGNDIEPVELATVLVKAKPIFQSSRWVNNTLQDLVSDNPATNADYFNVIKAIEKSDIQDTLSWFLDYDTGIEGAGDNFRYVRAATNLTDITIKFNLDIVYKYRPQENNSLTEGKNARLTLRAKYGQTYETATDLPFIYVSPLFEGTSNAEVTLPTELTATIPAVNATDLIWIYFRSTQGNGAVTHTIVNSSSVEISATSEAQNSIIRAIRLIDAMRYVVKSATGMNITAPRWDIGGELYDQYITTQSLMRNLIDKPVNVSEKDIVENHVQSEVNGDYQLQEDGTVYFGGSDTLADDFYQPYEIGSYTQADLTDEFGQPKGQITGYEESTNPKFYVNKFKLGFKNYASQKETEMANTFDDVHGESEWILASERAANTKDVKIGFIRSAFSWEEARRKAIDLTNTAATQDDDKIYITGVKEMTEADRVYSYTSTLQHVYDEDTGILTVRNIANSFSWITLAVAVTSQFIIVTGENAGTYTVINVSKNELQLVPDSVTPESIEEENTTYTYRVDESVTSLIAETDQDFISIFNIAEGNNYINLKNTVKRIILKRYNSFLATCNIFRKTDPVRNTLYKNNPDAITWVSGEPDPIREASNFVPSNPILTPKLVNVNIVMTMGEFFRMRAEQRTYNGFIRTFYSDGTPLKGFIQKGVWKADNRNGLDKEDFVGVLNATLEEKYEPFFMTIVGQQGGVIEINGQIAPNSFYFEIKNEKLFIYDETGKLLFVPIYYDRVKVNNSGSAISTVQLIQWLNALL